MTADSKALTLRFRTWLVLFILGVVLSGITAFPLVWEVDLLNRMVGPETPVARLCPPLAAWIGTVHEGLQHMHAAYPFIFYGTDWLAFGHLVIAIAFWGPLRDPVRNKWVIDFGIIACVLVIPLAMICGPIRHIPFFWRLIDCSFGVAGILPLLICRHYIGQLERIPAPQKSGDRQYS